MGTRTGVGMARRGLVPLGLGAALVALAGGVAPGYPEPPGEPGEVDALDAALLERPGPALRHALDSIEAGEVERAERLLVALAARHPVVGDYADLERIRLATLTGRTEEALARADAWDHPDSPLRAQVYTESGRARAERGEEQAARAAFEQALAATEEADARAELRVELARSHARSGNAEAAAEEFVEVWVRHPVAPAAEGIDADLTALEERLGRPLRTAERWRRRGDVLFRARRNEAALEAYERALTLGGLSRSAHRRAARQRAETLFRMRRYTEAADAFAELPRVAENRIAEARARARAGDVAGAAEELEVIARETRGPQGAYARLLAALLWEDEDEQRSLALFASLAAAGPGAPHAESALWRLGWEAYRARRYEEAETHLNRLVLQGGDGIAGLQARYWAARAAEQRGDAAAADRFGEMAREFPLSYYGWRASARASAGPAPPPTRVFDPGEPALTPAQLARPRILLEAGLPDAARAELGLLYPEAAGVEDRLALAELYSNAGDFNRAQRLVVGAYQETLARGPRHDALELWWHAWPIPYREAVLGATDERLPLDPELVYAIMREESGYRPEVRSVSGALGLMQLMPETAGQVAEREAIANFEVDALFRPDVNIQLGAAYLEELLRQFPGRPSAAIGSYNAGPHRVVVWLDGSTLEDDEWVEAIPYEQTRSYVKRVLRSLHAYRVLY